MLIGEIGREMFFCARGECEVLGPNEQRIFTVTDGMFFGEVAVLFSVKVTATVRTSTYCDLLSLSKESLGDAMRDYPKAAQIISGRAKERMKQLGIESTLLRDAVRGAASGSSASTLEQSLQQGGGPLQLQSPTKSAGKLPAIEQSGNSRSVSMQRHSIDEESFDTHNE